LSGIAAVGDLLLRLANQLWMGRGDAFSGGRLALVV
jgi:hypothetical protein